MTSRRDWKLKSADYTQVRLWQMRQVQLARLTILVFQRLRRL